MINSSRALVLAMLSTASGWTLPPAAAGRQTRREPPEAGEYRAQLLSDILPLSAADWLSDDGSTMQEARAQRAQLLSDILPLSAADWLSEVNPLAGY